MAVSEEEISTKLKVGSKYPPTLRSKAIPHTIPPSLLLTKMNTQDLTKNLGVPSIRYP